MAAEEVHLNDIGTSFEITIKEDGVVVDVSGASLKEIHFKKADGETVKQTAAFKTDGVDGVIKYVSVDGDINVKGDWEIQGKVTIAGGTYSSEIGKFEVFRNIL